MVDDDQPQPLIDEERRATEAALRDELHRAAVDELASIPTALMIAGDPFRAITDEANRLQADLVVMGSHANARLATSSQALPSSA